MSEDGLELPDMLMGSQIGFYADRKTATGKEAPEKGMKWKCGSRDVRRCCAAALLRY